MFELLFVISESRVFQPPQPILYQLANLVRVIHAPEPRGVEILALMLWL